MPDGSVRDQRVPALRAPALGDAVPLQDEVRHAALAQVLAHRHAGLTSADDEDLDLFLVMTTSTLEPHLDLSRCMLLGHRTPCPTDLLGG